MMSQRRGSAIAAVVLPVLCLLLVAELATSAEYTVGDSAGWKFNVVDWPNGKTFKAGDVLVFKYNKVFHNVVPVNKFSYDTCLFWPFGRTYRTGEDRITLVKGLNYFICGIPGHCIFGMKIAVNATD